jgi:3-oxoacyl-[acyl-carrier-protein] synthase-3
MASEDQATSDLALMAARDALAMAEVDPADLDAILVATCTPDHIFPATGCLVQAGLGATRAFGCDLEAACSGFLYGLSLSTGLIAAGMAENVLLIGAETLSRVTDYQDRRTCILFGDGAGAVVLRPARNNGAVMYTELGCDGSVPEILQIPAGGSRNPSSHETVDARMHYMRLQGREVFKLAVNKLTELLQRIPERTGVSLDDVKVVIPHQSNVRIVKSAFERSGLSLDQACMNIDRVGNTSAASIPIAMTEAVNAGRIERGDHVVFLAFGGGVTWGASLIRF